MIKRFVYIIQMGAYELKGYRPDEHDEGGGHDKGNYLPQDVPLVDGDGGGCWSQKKHPKEHDD